MPGLSLCIQGTLTCNRINKSIERFIPVYTGNTASPSYCPSSPRGLSLCIQGTPILYEFFSRRKRFIPVYTGNTFYLWDHTLKDSVYPCVYRQHSKKKTYLKNTNGLSLCIQGTLVLSGAQRG